VFVTGGAGTGKTSWLLHLINNVLPANGTAVTAATALAARQIGGSTLHSFAGIGLGDSPLEQTLQRIRGRPEVVRSWATCKVLVIDEISMVSASLFTLLDGVARAITKREKEPFGGIQLVLVGDFLQLPPVSRSGGENVKFCFESDAWRQAVIHPIQFDKDFRHGGDTRFARVCRELRFGSVSRDGASLLEECLRRGQEKESMDKLRRGMFGYTPVAITSTRADAEKINQQELSRIESVDFVRYIAEDHVAVNGIRLDDEVGTLEVLTLKLNAQVILTSNLHSDARVSNGDAGVVCRFAQQAEGPDLPVVRFTNGDEIVVEKVRSEVYLRGQVVAWRVQIPLILGWALTVHRVQGMTLPCAIVHLDDTIFERGQAYVAVSRVKSSEGLMLTALNLSAFKADATVVEAYSHWFPKSKLESPSFPREPSAKRDRSESP
jgi:ATP-dependent DNA helicase PIF1